MKQQKEQEKQRKLDEIKAQKEKEKEAKRE